MKEPEYAATNTEAGDENFLIVRLQLSTRKHSVKDILPVLSLRKDSIETIMFLCWYIYAKDTRQKRFG